MLKKNTAGQKWRVYAFNRTTNAPVLGDAANITAKLSKDWAAGAALGDVNPVETEDGSYLFDLTQAESNADNLDLYPQSTTANVQVIGTPASQSTWTPDIAAILAKTNLIPAVPASEPNATANYNSLASYLVSIVDYLNPEIASIKTTCEANQTTLAALSKLANADLIVDTTVTPWALVFIENGTGGLGVGTELLRQPLKDVTGANITATDQIVGRAGL